MSPTRPPGEGAGASAPGSRPSPEDRTRVARLLGREPFTDYRIAVRCPFGGPAVLENDPVDLEGRPFPTRFWLACRHLHAAVSRVEAGGGVRQLEHDVALGPDLEEAHREHAALHAGYNVGGVADRGRVKCLHAQLAFALATGGNPVGDWVLARVGDRWPEACCADEPAVGG